MSTDRGMARREFLRRSAVGAGLAAGATAADAQTTAQEPRLPRELFVAALGQEGMEAADPPEMAQRILAEMEKVVSFRPDVVALPETVLFTRVRTLPTPAVAAEISPDLARPFSDFAKRNRCYVVFPTYTREGGRTFVATLLLDRQGQLLGEYRKMRPAEDEMEAGISPGPPDPPVFRTDFGVVGAQICFDIEWAAGWDALRAKGAELVFWSSAFAGGSKVNRIAWQHRMPVVASTRKDTAKICDVSGEELARTGRWSPRWALAPVNLEKVVLHTWPYNRHFDAIRAKYGRDVRLTTFDEEERTVLESRSASVRVPDVMAEFGLRSYEETTARAERMHEAAWGRS